MACTIKRDALIQQHAALRCNPSFVLRPRKPRPPLLVVDVAEAHSIETSPTQSCPKLPTPVLEGELSQEYWQLARPFYRLARLPSEPGQLAEIVTPPIASPTKSRKDPVRLKTSKLMRYYGPHLLSLTVSTLDIGQLERKMNLRAKRALGAWRLCVSGRERAREMYASLRESEHTHARENERARAHKRERARASARA